MNKAVLILLVYNGLASSRQRGFHPKPLTDPYMILSHHTAPDAHKSRSQVK